MDALCLIWSLKAEPWQDMGAEGVPGGSQEAGSGEVRGAGGGGVHEPGPLGLVGLAEQCPAGREARRLLPVTCSLDHHLLA